MHAPPAIRLCGRRLAAFAAKPPEELAASRGMLSVRQEVRHQHSCNLQSPCPQCAHSFATCAREPRSYDIPGLKSS
eukprot:1985174-Alexandrium_andersonii.AAC.1